MTFRWALLTPWKPFDVMWDNNVPLLFRTRKAARNYATASYGYIKERKDLRTEPHNWRMPRPVEVSVDINPLFKVTKSKL